MASWKNSWPGIAAETTRFCSAFHATLPKSFLAFILRRQTTRPEAAEVILQTGREEADCGLVQRELEESIERDRALAPDEARDGIGGRAG